MVFDDLSLSWALNTKPMKTKIIPYLLTLLGVIMTLSISCKKDDENIEIIFNSNLTYGTVTDIDGNVYKTITIGTQTWMAENLRVTHYLNGEAIPEVTNNSAWTNLITGAYCNFENTSNTKTIATYGRLYNWYAVSDSRNLCPSGWHVPSDNGWCILSTYLDPSANCSSEAVESEIAGGKMKETGTTHWIGTNQGTTNESGFTALPAGERSHDYGGGPFNGLGASATWWSSTAFVEYGDSYARTRNLWLHDPSVFRLSNTYICGYSVRCVKD
jgi:uncharacterized protein (TIGR02145 family)